jgi:hypothetical protein
MQSDIAVATGFVTRDPFCRDQHVGCPGVDPEKPRPRVAHQLCTWDG